MTEPKYKLRDWLRWMRNGLLVIGEVQYIKDAWPSSSEPEYVTDAGMVSEDEVLECRAADLGKNLSEERE